jgi:hypothetical protein
VAVRAVGSLKEPRRMTANFTKLPDLLRGNKSPTYREALWTACVGF